MAKQNSPNAPTRLWVKAAFTGFRRSHHTQNSNQVLLKLQGVNTKTDVAYYHGKRVVYIYKGQSKNGSNFRTIWGRISRAHGDQGVAIARFATNLPPSAIGSTLRVMLYPNRA